MPWAQCAGWGMAILISIGACGGATRENGGDGSDSGVTGSHADGGGSSSDGGTSGMGKQRLKCSDLSEGAPCSQGDTCDSDCSNPCQFCNLLVCSSGQWSGVEVFPLPPTDPMCSDAGDASAEASATPH